MDAYISGRSAYGIAIEKGVSPTTIVSALKRGGITIRGIKEAAHGRLPDKKNVSDDTIIKMYLSGKTQREIAREYDMDSSSIWHRLKRNSIPLPEERARSLGKPRSVVTSARMQNIPIEKWTGYSTDPRNLIMLSKEWKQWRTGVFKRDGFKCFFCGYKGRLKENPLHPHHIYPKSQYPDRIFDINNGITLCKKHHMKINSKEYAYAPMFDIYLAQFNAA